MTDKPSLKERCPHCGYELDGRHEEWRQLPGIPMYDVSDTGRIRSRHFNPPRIMQPYTRKFDCGYKRVTYNLTLNGKCRTISAYEAVLRAFVGPRPEGAVARHLNGDSLDNRLANLAYGTVKENVHDAIRHGTSICGRKRAS